MDYDIPHQQLLVRYGKSFHWASLFLNRNQSYAAKKIYAFCRYLDDVVDECGDKKVAQQELNTIKADIKQGHSKHAIVQHMCQLMLEYDIQLQVVCDLIDGVGWDLRQQTIVTEADLYRYSYGVAGTVGLLMCALFRVSHPQARAYAIDLGIAMQFTNIARDVREDAHKGRVYLPQQWFATPIDAAMILTKQLDAMVYARIKKLIGLATHYYRSADYGLVYLPWRARLSILIASKVYAAIGAKCLKLGCRAYWQMPRVFTTIPQKISLSLMALTQLLVQSKYHKILQLHNRQLHRHIHDVVTYE